MGKLYMVLLLPGPPQELSACQQPISTNPKDHRDFMAGEEHKIRTQCRAHTIRDVT